MFNKKEIMFFVMAAVMGIMLAYACRLQAEETGRKKIILKEWSTQLVYDTTNACYQGTLKWIVMTNPALYGIPPGFESSRQMLLHCFCVMDRIQKKITIEEYQKRVFDSLWVGNLFMSIAVECVREDATLPSFFTKIPDNETNKGDHEIKSVIPKAIIPDDSPEKLPSEEEELEEEERPETIFQG